MKKRLFMFGMALLMCVGAFAGEPTKVNDYSAGIFGGEDTVGVWGKVNYFGIRAGVVEGEELTAPASTPQACRKKNKPCPRPTPLPTEWVAGDAQFVSFQGYFPFAGPGKCSMGRLNGHRNRVACRFSGFVGAGLSRTEEFRGLETNDAYNMEYNIGAEVILPVGLVLNGGYDSLVEGFVGIGWGRTFGQ